MPLAQQQATDQQLGGLTPIGSPAPALGQPSAGADDPQLPSAQGSPQPSSSSQVRGPGPSGAPLPGGGDVDHRPLAVGLLYTNNDAAGSAGIDNGNTFTQRRAFEAMVQVWNSRGGLAGRRIVATYVELRSSSSNLPADLQKACTTFTQDKHVAVVLSTTGTFSDAFAQCMARVGTPVLAGDYALGDAASLAAAPTYFAPASVNTDRRALGVLARYVSSTDKVGVVVEACSYDLRTYQHVLLPEAQRRGLTVADQAQTRCFQGLNDLAGQASDMQAAVLRFASKGVNKVVFVSGGNEGNLMLLFGTAAEAQSYRPHYALTSAVAAVIQEANTPKRQLANAVGLGWLPSLDTTQSIVTTATRRCAADLKKGAGLTPASGADRYFAYSTCDLFSLYDTVLRHTAGDTRPARVGAAVHALGRTVAGAAVLGGATDFTSRQDGPAQAREFAWASSCSCFRYRGPSFSLN